MKTLGKFMILAFIGGIFAIGCESTDHDSGNKNNRSNLYNKSSKKSPKKSSNESEQQASKSGESWDLML